MKHSVLVLSAWYCIINMHFIGAQHIQHSSDNFHYMHDVDTEKNQLNIDDSTITNEDQSSPKTKKTCCVGPRGPVGPQGPTGPAGTFSASYGQLSVTSQVITLTTDNTWVVVPFDESGPTSNTTVSTTAPATITVQKAGVYQINVSLYFSAENSLEDTFNTTTYRLGVNVNGVTTASAGTYAQAAGGYSLNYSTIKELAVNDTIQFYMEASNTDTPPFANIVTLENGSAYVMQISS